MPSMSPSNPTSNPSSTPSSKASYPTASPSTNPSNPTSNPSTAPSHNPSAIPSVHPTSNPSAPPSLNPTLNPSAMPSSNPTSNPSVTHSPGRSNSPSRYPSFNPSYPTTSPSTNPTNPTRSPSTVPSLSPSHSPSLNPSLLEAHIYVFKVRVAWISSFGDTSTLDQLYFRLCRNALCSLFRSIPNGLQSATTYQWNVTTRADYGTINTIQIVHTGYDHLCLNWVDIDGVTYDAPFNSDNSWCWESNPDPNSCSTLTVTSTNAWNASMTVPCEYASMFNVTYDPTSMPTQSTANPITAHPTLSPPLLETVDESTDKSNDNMRSTSPMDCVMIGIIVAACALGCCVGMLVVMGAIILYKKNSDTTDGRAQQVEMQPLKSEAQGSRTNNLDDDDDDDIDTYATRPRHAGYLQVPLQQDSDETDVVGSNAMRYMLTHGMTSSADAIEHKMAIRMEEVNEYDVEEEGDNAHEEQRLDEEDEYDHNTNPSPPQIPDDSFAHLELIGEDQKDAKENEDQSIECKDNIEYNILYNSLAEGRRQGLPVQQQVFEMVNVAIQNSKSWETESSSE
eukprot:612115_1